MVSPWVWENIVKEIIDEYEQKVMDSEFEDEALEGEEYQPDWWREPEEKDEVIRRLPEPGDTGVPRVKPITGGLPLKKWEAFKTKGDAFVWPPKNDDCM